ARRAHNPKVIGSNPVPATNILKGRSVTYWSAFFVACLFKFLCAHIVPTPCPIFSLPLKIKNLHDLQAPDGKFLPHN
ncbi:hypothetical protein, partial [Vreelandella sedimenti]|uniref:hypothetical protein n=1 Tax=Vreelandella sedimenti TaxID=2729618 RepID=UPI0030DCD81D